MPWNAIVLPSADQAGRPSARTGAAGPTASATISGWPAWPSASTTPIRLVSSAQPSQKNVPEKAILRPSGEYAGSRSLRTDHGAPSPPVWRSKTVLPRVPSPSTEPIRVSPEA